MFIVKFNKSVLVTYLGVVFGCLSMYFAFSQLAFSEVNHIKCSLIFLMLSGICDMFDGKVARMCKRTKEEKEFGIQIDSLADTVNFICVPVVIMLSLGMDSIYHVIIYILFVLAGVSRLGYFNTIASLDSPVKYYNGLPVTSTAIIYPVLGLFYGKIDQSAFCNMYITFTLLTAFLFIYKFKVPKLKGKAYVVVPILAALLLVLLLVIR